MKNLILVVFFLSGCPQAFGWGKIGHEATAVVATKFLKSQVRLKIQHLLGMDDLREASVWADRIRAEASWQHSRPFHFTQISDGTSYYETLKSAYQLELTRGDAIRALIKAEDILRDPKATSLQKTYALKFFIHVMGDIHQPLHTGRPQDFGGNTIPMDWFGLKTSLHSVWDTQIIVGSEINQQQSDRYIASLPTVDLLKARAWRRGNYLDWLNEAMALRETSYQSAVLTNEEVLGRYKNLVNEQILKSAFRLGHMLNEIFSENAVSRDGIQLRDSLKKLLGSQHGTYITIEPSSQIDSEQFVEDGFDCQH